MSTTSILIVEDERLIRWSLRERLQHEGYEIDEADSIQAGLAKFNAGLPDLVLLDYRLPDGSAQDFLDAIGKQVEDCVVIIITAYGTVETAVSAIKQGVYDFITKPFNVDDLARLVARGLERTKLRRQLVQLRRELANQYGFDRLLGRSPPMIQLFETLARVAASPASTVFLRGDSGTGKDLVARMIHFNSARAAAPFVNITCTALTETLLESELFGHERGAFTDARSTKKGMFEIADGGTAFLDEVGDMLAGLQAKLLRFLEEKTFRRVGGTQDIRVDVRIIAATNRDIEKALEKDSFRRDLFYRLSVITIDLPPLRERGDDILLLANHFIDLFSRDFHKRVEGISDDATDLLMTYPWPGNVRELRNVLERAVLLCSGRRLEPDDFPSLLAARDAPLPEGELVIQLPRGGIRFDEVEKQLVEQALQMANQNQTRAAKLLRMSRDQLRYRMEKFGLA